MSTFIRRDVGMGRHVGRWEKAKQLLIRDVSTSQGDSSAAGKMER